MKKKNEPGKSFTSEYISIFQVFYPTDVEIEVFKPFLSPYEGDFFVSIGTTFHEIFVVMLTMTADLAMIMPLTNRNLLDFRVTEK